MAARGTLVAPGSVRFERMLSAPFDRVWGYLTDPEGRARWLAGGTMQQHVGGRVKLEFRHDALTGVDDPPPDAYRSMAAAGHVARGVVTAWEPMRRLAHTWEDGAEISEVGFELHDAGDAVRLTVVHRRLENRAMVVDVAAGWDAHLSLLAAVVAGEPRPAYWSAFVASQARHAEAFAGRSEAAGRPAGYATLRALEGGGHRLAFDRVVAAPVADVWEALAEPAQRDRWYPAELRFEGPVGGWARERFPDDPTPLPEGRLTRWQEERRLSFAFEGDPTSPEASVHDPQSVDIALVADGDTTRVTFAYGFADRSMAAAFAAGWHACLEALVGVVEGRDVVTDLEALRSGYAAWMAVPFDAEEDGVA